MANIKTHKIGIIMNGVTGRMGTNQHLMRSIVAIIKQGGVAISDDEVIMPDPILVGRNSVKLEKLVALSGIEKWTTDVDSVLADPHYPIYFDAQTTDRRYAAVKEAIKAKKHIYCEKPTAQTTQEALDLYKAAEKAGLKHGVVQDKLWLPGLLKLKVLIDTGFFGKIHIVQGDFGYWVFEGEHVPSQRPSWNYRKEDGGGIILDLFPHWRYLLDNLFGNVMAVSCLGATHVKKRWQENGELYTCTADDAAYATLELENDIMVQFNSSWATRVRRDDLLTLHVDGSHGSAVAGLRNCVSQPYTHTPRPVWNPDIDSPIDYYDRWTSVPAFTAYDNAFKIQWELFLRYVVKDEPYSWDLLEGAKGIQLAELAHESWQSRKWLEVPDL